MEKIVGRNRGNHAYVDTDDYLYKAYSRRKSRAYLRCFTNTCKGRVIWDKNCDDVRVMVSHDKHPNHRNTIVDLRFREKLRQSSLRNPELTPRQLFDQELELLDADDVRIVSFSKTRGVIKNARQSTRAIEESLEEDSSSDDEDDESVAG